MYVETVTIFEPHLQSAKLNIRGNTILERYINLDVSTLKTRGELCSSPVIKCLKFLM